MTDAPSETPEQTGAADAEPLANLDHEGSDPGTLDEFKTANRRRIVTVVGLALLLVLSFVVGEWHAAWRAIVLDVRADAMFVAYEKKPPEWVDGRLAEPGHIVAKESWRWDAEPKTVDVGDEALVALYQRYTKVYTGTVLEVRNPVKQGSFPLAVIRTDDGGREYVTLVDTVLFGVEVNRRVEKVRGSWDPKLLPKDPSAVQMAPPTTVVDAPSPVTGAVPPAPSPDDGGAARAPPPAAPSAPTELAPDPAR
jgi:hypothetical protein